MKNVFLPSLWIIIACQNSVGQSIGTEQPRAADPSTQSLEKLANISYETDIRIFAVMAALNAAGFDYEVPQKQMSRVRQGVRREMEQLDADLSARLQVFYIAHRRHRDESKEQIAYTSLALSISGPPDFELSNLDEENMPEDVRHLRGFENLVRELYQVADIPSLWKRYEREHRSEAISYRPIFQDAIHQTLDYFRIPARIALDRSIILIPDLLNIQNVVNARNTEHVYYIVVGPAEGPARNRIQLQHEYLHFLIDPLIEKFGVLLLKHEELLSLSQQQPRIKHEYQNNYLVIVAESIIESILMRLYQEQNPDERLVELFRRGLIFAPHFYRSLQLYERSELISFPSYVETVFKGISEPKIKDDAEVIARLEIKLKEVRQKKLAAEQLVQTEAVRRSRINSLLAEAGDLLRKGQFKLAQEKLNELLQADPENSNAYFYLAQIASQHKEHGIAFEYYRKVSQFPQMSLWIRAWSLLRMGRLLAHQGDFEGAHMHFKQVLELAGDLKGAREKAKASMAHLPNPW